MAHCIYFKDTALHFAAASYSPEMTDKLIEAGANVRAKIRRGTEPLSCCSSRKSRLVPMGSGGEAATIFCLIAAGANPTAQNMGVDGVGSAHLADV